MKKPPHPRRKRSRTPSTLAPMSHQYLTHFTDNQNQGLIPDSSHLWNEAGTGATSKNAESETRTELLKESMRKKDEKPPEDKKLRSFLVYCAGAVFILWTLAAIYKLVATGDSSLFTTDSIPTILFMTALYWSLGIPIPKP